MRLTELNIETHLSQTGTKAMLDWGREIKITKNFKRKQFLFYFEVFMLTKKVSMIKVCIVLRNLQNPSEGGRRQYILALLLLSPQVLQPLGNRNAIFTNLSISNPHSRFFFHICCSVYGLFSNFRRTKSSNLGVGEVIFIWNVEVGGVNRYFLWPPDVPFPELDSCQ